MNVNRRKLKRENTQQLQLLTSQHGLSLLHLSEHHLRVCGPTVVDYWPGSSKAWTLGSVGQAIFSTPKKVVEVALKPRPVKIPLTRATKPDLLPPWEDENVPPWQ